uniref:Uncharacterized protein n=1 Tax=Oryza glumipatula TaxID=40148 RepID=A0A0D9YVA2_9ORYZ
MQDRKGHFPPQKLAIEVRGSPTTNVGLFNNLPPSHIGVAKPFTVSGPPPAPQAPTVHQAFTRVYRARDVNLVWL